MAEPISNALGADEALVLFELLSRWRESDQLTLNGEAEWSALSALLGALESELGAPFASDYGDQLAAARARLTP